MCTPIRLVVLSALTLGLPFGAAAAQQPPACRAETVGTVACMAGRMCACRIERAGRMTGATGGFRWDCGILRPACGGGPETPAMTGDYPEVLAPAVGLDLALPAPRPRPRPLPRPQR